MTSDEVTAGDPRIADFTGDSAGQVARRLLHATRPKFAPASLLPVLAGSAWGFAAAGAFDIGVFLLALVATLAVHAAANVLNDVGDESGGSDRVNEDRIYPYTGGSRFIQAGIMSSPAMARFGISLLAVAALAGLGLLLARGPLVLAFGLAGVALCVLYSLGPLRLSNLGIGEAAVCAGFGVLPVTGAAWLQSGIIDLDLLIFSLPVGAWATAILLINEVPDMAADAQTGKRTLPVRLGLGGTSALYFALHLGALAAVLLLATRGALPWSTPIVPIALMALATRAAGAIRHGTANRDALRKAIEGTLGIHTIGSLWLCAVVLYTVFWPAAS